MSRSPHDPARFNTYQRVHFARMAGFRSRDFVHGDTLVFEFGAPLIRLRGRVACLGEIVVTVDEVLRVPSGEGSKALVRVVRYAYNASLRGHGNIRRYDNVHPHPGHIDAHHRHDFDWRSGEELRGSPIWVGEHGWPALSQFLEQIEVWYWEHREELPHPDGVVPDSELE